MTVKTRKKQGRSSASPIPVELPSTTCRKELGGNRALEIGAKERFSADDVAAVESMASIELACLLEMPDAFIADYSTAVRPPKKHELNADERDYLEKLRRSREHSPAERENLKKALYARSRSEREALLRECRRNIKKWLKLVRLYEINRDWLQQFSPVIRKILCRQMADGVARATANDVPSIDREHERERARNRREATRAAKRLRKQYKWRGKTDGRGIDGDGFKADGHGFGGSDGYRHARRQPSVLVSAHGEFDDKANAEAELLIARSSWLRSRTNAGYEIVQGTIEEQGDQWSVTEDYRIMKRLTEEVQVFWKRKKKRSI